MQKGILTFICIVSIALFAACSDDTTQDPPPDPDSKVPDQFVKPQPDKTVPDKPRDSGPPPDVGDGMVPDQPLPPDQKVIPGKCVLAMKINGTAAKSGTAYSKLDDKDSTKTGIQVDVEVKVTGVSVQKDIDLAVTGQTKATLTSVSSIATFKGVTLDPKSVPITIEATGKDCTGAKTLHTITEDPTCVFISPSTATLNALKHDIQIKTTNATGGQVDLEINSKPAQPASMGKPDSVGVVTFKGTELAVGKNDIKATVTVTLAGGKLTGTCSPTNNPVQVVVAAPKCNCCTFSPTPQAIAVAPKAGLGVKEDSDGNLANGVQTTITVTTDATNVDSLELDLGDGSPVITKSVTADKVTFPVTIKEGLHTIKATCKSAKNKNQASGTFKILVDVTKPKAVDDLACAPKGSQNRKGEVTCTWKGVTDPGTNPAGIKQYDLRHLTGTAITTTNWATATSLTVPGAPTNTKVVDKMVMPKSYYFGITAEDHLGNISAAYFPTSGTMVKFNEQEILGAAAGDNFGNTIVLGDFNCDNLTDLAVGISSANSKKGEVQLFFGTGAGYPKVASKKISGTLTSQKFGLRLAAMNFDGDTDNCTDLAVGAENADSNRGRVYLYLGRKLWKDRDDVGTGSGAEIIYHLDTTKTGKDQLGAMLSGLDLDGDKAGDLAMLYWDKTKDFAQVLVDYGETTGITPMQTGQAPVKRLMPDKADVKIIGGKASTYFGTPIVRGGLLTSGDSAEEMLIGSSFESDSSGNKGAVYVILGKAAMSGVETIDVSTTPLPTRVVKIVGSSSSSLFGLSMAGVGDLNGDGTAEFVVGDMGFGAYKGQAYIFNLATTPKTLADAKAIVNNDLTTNTTNMLARSIANGVEVKADKGADLNNDGVADMIFGMNYTGAVKAGSAQIFFGKKGTTLSNYSVSKADLVLQPPKSSSAFSSSNAFIADVNGDGYPDVVVTDYAYSGKKGRALIYY